MRSKSFVFVHRSHFLDAFRHSSDERNPANVTRRRVIRIPPSHRLAFWVSCSGMKSVPPRGSGWVVDSKLARADAWYSGREMRSKPTVREISGTPFADRTDRGH